MASLSHPTVLAGLLKGVSNAAQGFSAERDLRRAAERQRSTADYTTRLGMMEKSYEQQLRDNDPLRQVQIQQAQAGIEASQASTAQSLAQTKVINEQPRALTDELNNRASKLDLAEREVALAKQQLKIDEDLEKLRRKSLDADDDLKAKKSGASVALREKYNRLLEIAADNTSGGDYVKALGELSRWTDNNLSLIENDPLFRGEVRSIVRVDKKPEEVGALARTRVAGLGRQPNPTAEAGKTYVGPTRSPYLGALGVQDAGSMLNPLTGSGGAGGGDGSANTSDQA